MLLASDYDNTFYTDEENIKKNIEKVKEFRKDNIFVMATGRSEKDFKKVQDKYNISCDYLIINHGASLIKDSEYIFTITMDEKTINKIKELLLKSATISFCCNKTSSRTTIEDKNLTKIRLEFKSKKELIKQNNILLNNLKDEINTFITGNLGLEIVSKKATKERALLKIKELENLNDNEIFAVGDSYTDIKMLNAYQGYRMENSIKELEFLPDVQSVHELIDIITNKNIVIAIDGKSATGKSTIAELLAEELNFNYLNTGYIYRTIAYALEENNLKEEDITEEFLDTLKINLINNQAYLNGVNVTDKILNQKITILSTICGSNKIIKKRVRKFQKDFAKENNIVVEGRDIATRIFPTAKYKFYLYASLEERTKRLFNKRKQTEDVTYENVLKELQEKDLLDEKSNSFIKPKDAYEIDTTNKTIEEIVQLMLKQIKN